MHFTSETLTAPPAGGTNGDIFVKKSDNGAIIADGNFADWPLDAFTEAAVQPAFPGVRGGTCEAPSFSGAQGDHIIFDENTRGGFSGTPAPPVHPELTDFGAELYFTYDDTFLYALGIFIDDGIDNFSDVTPEGCGGWINDGMEFFFDANNDSACTGYVMVPNTFNTFDPYTDDFQITMAPNVNFADAADAGDLGAGQHIERSGDAASIGCTGTYKAALAAHNAVGTRTEGSRAYADLAAAGAQNPVILANPGTTFAGYALEVAIPWGSLPGLDPVANPVMSFNPFITDAHNSAGDANACCGGQHWWIWTQNTAFACGPETIGEVENWAQMHFTGDSLTGGEFRRGDGNGDGTVNLADAVFGFTFLFLGGEAPTCKITLDANNDDEVNLADSVFILNWLFLGEDGPAAPGPFDCGIDPTSSVGCASYDC